jgi:Fe-S cluster biogenesis protein NfuA
MFIQTEQTPNPATLKFLPGRTVMESGTANFPEAATAERSPLAERLFTLEGVTGVFLGSDFVTVSKDDRADWYQLKPAILGVIMEHFTSGRPVILAGAGEGAAEAGEDDEIAAQIRELIETRVRPAVAQDGGDIVYRGYKDGTLFLAMQGACHGCPSSAVTLKRGIEGLIRHYVPEVETVEAV